MRVMRGHLVTEVFWSNGGEKHVLTRGWWLGIRHACARGRVFKPMLRVFFVDERELLFQRIYKRRHVLQTTACRHCHTMLYVNAYGPEYEGMRIEAETLVRLSINQVKVRRRLLRLQRFVGVPMLVVRCRLWGLVLKWRCLST